MKKWLAMAVLPLFMLCGLCGCGDTSTDKDPKIELSESSLTLTVGDKATLTASGEGYHNLSWETDGGEVVTITETKEAQQINIVAKAAGTTTIRAVASTESGEEVSASCSVTVQESLIRVNVPAGKLVLKRGKSATVKAYITGDVSGDVVWESSDVSIGTVEYQGLIAVVTTSTEKSGTCVITVRCGNAKSSFELVCGLA